MYEQVFLLIYIERGVIRYEILLFGEKVIIHFHIHFIYKRSIPLLHKWLEFVTYLLNILLRYMYYTTIYCIRIYRYKSFDQSRKVGGWVKTILRFWGIKERQWGIYIIWTDLVTELTNSNVKNYIESNWKLRWVSTRGIYGDN